MNEELPCVDEEETEVRTNQFGYTDVYLVHDGSNNPICPQCRSYKIPNTGQGRFCSSCAADFERECRVNFDEMNGL